jgi:uracil-DNA glycosylase
MSTSGNMQKTLDSFFSGGKRAATEAPEGEKAPKKQKTESSDKAKTPIDDSGLDPVVAEYVGYLQDPGWKEALMPEFKKPYFKQLIHFVKGERDRGATVYPPTPQIFNAFNYCPLDTVKVVLLGQDPYHGPGQAHGLSFSVQHGVPTPPSLKNMYKELQTDIKGWQVPKHGYLEKWARQGVLLLNAVLTVERATPNSHAKKGWEQFTDAALKKVNTDRESAVFFLWGAYAQKKEPLINKGKHLVLKSGHPSPLSVKHFLGCKHFSKANEFLQKKGLDTIDWQLDLEDSAAGVNDSTDAEQSPKKKAATTKKAPPKKKAAAKKDSEEEPEEEDDE